MPLHQGSDSKGAFWQWGTHGKKYHYKTVKGGETAKKKAIAQAVAINYHSKKKEKI